MIVSVVCAAARGRVIGYEGRIPWRIPDDLRNFKRLTMGKTVVMGRKTYRSIGRALPGRRCLVLSRSLKVSEPGIELCGSFSEALGICSSEPEVMVIGGADLIGQVMPVVSRQYLSIVQADFAGDAFYPDFDPFEWRPSVHIHHPVSAGSPLPWDFLRLERL